MVFVKVLVWGVGFAVVGSYLGPMFGIYLAPIIWIPIGVVVAVLLFVVKGQRTQSPIVQEQTAYVVAQPPPRVRPAEYTRDGYLVRVWTWGGNLSRDPELLAVYNDPEQAAEECMRALGSYRFADLHIQKSGNRQKLFDVLEENDEKTVWYTTNWRPRCAGYLRTVEGRGAYMSTWNDRF